MINFEEGMAWAKHLKRPEALKTTRQLFKEVDKNQFACCCLGDYCLMIGYKPSVNPNSVIAKPQIWVEEDCVHEYATLTPHLQKRLNILSTGRLTHKGTKIVKQFFEIFGHDSSHYKELTTINDHITKDDVTLFRMGSLIETLIAHEQLFGEECFECHH